MCIRTYVCVCMCVIYQLNNCIQVLSSESVEFSLPDRYPPSVHSSEMCDSVPGFSCTEYNRNLGGASMNI